MRPIIGLTPSLESGEHKIYTPTSYPKAIIEAGGTPVFFNFTRDDEMIEAYAAMVDGVLFSGGDDVDPSTYGEEQIWGCGDIVPLRDDFEIKLLKVLVEKYPDALIVFMTPLHRLNEEGYAPDRRDLRSYVQAIREVCEYYSLPVLDLYATYGVNPEIPVMMERFMPDGLHPNAAGHRLLTEQLGAFLRACPEKRRIL